MPFTFYKQYDSLDCGPTCLKMIAKYYGKDINIEFIREKAMLGKSGTSMLGISKAAESIGFSTLASNVSDHQLIEEVPLPCIAFWNQNHYVVIHKIQKRRSQTNIHVADPAFGNITYTKTEFMDKWVIKEENQTKKGIVLMFEPTPIFYENPDNSSSTKKISDLFKYVNKYKKLVIQLFLGLFIGSILQLILPFLTQSIVDVGIQNRNLNFIKLVLIAQTMLLIGGIGVEFTRSWLLLHISTRINLSILSDFLTKLLKLPISFFESKPTGDILQRIGDHKRIESFLTSNSLNLIFSSFTFLIFGVVLFLYSPKIFIIFIVASILYILWVRLFLNYRKVLDHKRFALASQRQNNLIQLIQSVVELKLNNSETRKKWEWENLQIKDFKLNIKSLSLQQYQHIGALFLNEGKNILITFVSANSVVNGEITLGSMMALQYIIGHLNSPIEQFILFSQQLQDAQISIERLNDINEVKNEDSAEYQLLKSFQRNSDITLKNITFSYPNINSPVALKSLNLTFPSNKITAIVGVSGCGKTTILKLLLKFFIPDSGSIFIGNTRLEDIEHSFWRSNCGVVMQDGYIFSDTIANNVTISDDIPNLERLIFSLETANLLDFVNSLPQNYNTRIGIEGMGLSQGQKQRILIARAVYKNPDFLFLDEATNALDANNESIIMANLNNFFRGKTVIVVAHRLSTVKNADQIIVLEKGEVVEIGTHFELTQKHGKYFELVKNQLELGN